jgi:hypothetical protein
MNEEIRRQLEEEQQQQQRFTEDTEEQKSLYTPLERKQLRREKRITDNKEKARFPIATRIQNSQASEVTNKNINRFERFCKTVGFKYQINRDCFTMLSIKDNDTLVLTRSPVFKLKISRIPGEMRAIFMLVKMSHEKIDDSTSDTLPHDAYLTSSTPVFWDLAWEQQNDGDMANLKLTELTERQAAQFYKSLNWYNPVSNKRDARQIEALVSAAQHKPPA